MNKNLGKKSVGILLLGCFLLIGAQSISPDNPLKQADSIKQVLDPMAADNLAPIISDLSVNGTYETWQDWFNFTLTYTDADNDAPQYVQVVIDNYRHNMSKVDSADNTYSDGVEYTYLTLLSAGTHGYYFLANDSFNETRAPEVGYLMDVTVATEGIIEDGNTIVINGQIDFAEWTNAKYYEKTDKRGMYDTYILRNSTHLLFAINTSDIVNSGVDSVWIYFDEYNDGFNGSGSFDGKWTTGQEDFKKIENFVQYDGCFWDPQYVADDTDWEAKMVWNTTNVNHYEIEFAIPFQGRDGDPLDPSDLNTTILDVIAWNFYFYGTSSFVGSDFLGEDAYSDQFPLDLATMKWGFENFSVPQISPSEKSKFVFDGVVDLENEWQNALEWQNGSIRKDLEYYFYQNGTHLLIGILTDEYDIDDDQVINIYLDEGDDGTYGSGTRDCVGTSNQDDLKSWNYFMGGRLYDGYFQSGSWTSTQYSSLYPGNYEVAYSTTNNRLQYEFAIPLQGGDGEDRQPDLDYSDLNVKLNDTIGIQIGYRSGYDGYLAFPYDGDYSYSHLKYFMGLSLGDFELNFDEEIEGWQSASLNGGVWINGTSILNPGKTLQNIEIMPITTESSNLTSGTFSANLGNLNTFSFTNTSNIPDGEWYITVKGTTTEGNSLYFQQTIKIDSSPPNFSQTEITMAPQGGDHDAKVYIDGTFSDIPSGIETLEIISGSGNLSVEFVIDSLDLEMGTVSFTNSSNLETGEYWAILNITDHAGNELNKNVSINFIDKTPAELTNFQMSATSGTMADIFVVSIDVVQAQNFSIQSLSMQINETLNIPLLKSNEQDMNYTDGVTYQYEGTLPHGDLNFTFNLDDGRYIINHFEDPVINISQDLVCPDRKTSFSFNGYISAGEWDNALEIDQTTQSTINQAKAYFMYDSNFLYVGVESYEGTDLRDQVMIFYFDLDGDGSFTNDRDLSFLCWESVSYGFWTLHTRTIMWEEDRWQYVGEDYAYASYKRAFTSSPSNPVDHAQFEFRLDITDPLIDIESGDSIKVGFKVYDTLEYRANYFPMILDPNDPKDYYNLTLQYVYVDNPPTSTHPVDRILTYNQTGSDCILSWQLNDDHGAGTYRIVKDGSEEVVTNQTWIIGQLISYTVNTTDSLGNHQYSIIFSDNTGNVVQDDVTVQINAPPIENQAPSIISINTDPAIIMDHMNITVIMESLDDNDVLSASLNITLPNGQSYIYLMNEIIENHWEYALNETYTAETGNLIIKITISDGELDDTLTITKTINPNTEDSDPTDDDSAGSDEGSDGDDTDGSGDTEDTGDPTGNTTLDSMLNFLKENFLYVLIGIGGISIIFIIIKKRK